jgi:glycosyltransferase involved in cell wall biosynthesis
MESKVQIHPNIQLKRYRSQKPKLSIILIDWSVRESFHSIDYLNKQTASRSDYELIWIEMYNNSPEMLKKKVAAYDKKGLSALDQWITLGLPKDCSYHKHFAYNVGIALARGDICVICDSDAMFPPLFIEKIISKFDEKENIVLHIDQIRNSSKKFYPFNYPKIKRVINDKNTVNWCKDVTQGLNNSSDMLHEANYGACMAAKREHLLAICGADEHSDYLGYICGPYELTFRLINFGCQEIWLRDIFIIHTWHPSEGGNDNFCGPDDGRRISLRALEAKNSGRIYPCVTNSVIKAMNNSDINYDHKTICDAFNFINLNSWYKNAPKLFKLSVPTLIEANIDKHNVIHFDEYYYLFPQSEGAFLTENVANGKYNHVIRSRNLSSLKKVIRTFKYKSIARGLIHPRLLSYIKKLSLSN